MLPKLTAMQEKFSEMFDKFTAMSQPCRIGCPRNVSKALKTAEKLTAMQDRMFQRCFKS